MILITLYKFIYSIKYIYLSLCFDIERVCEKVVILKLNFGNKKIFKY